MGRNAFFKHIKNNPNQTTTIQPISNELNSNELNQVPSYIFSSFEKFILNIPHNREESFMPMWNWRII